MKKIAILAVLLVSSIGMAQKVKVKSGDYKFLAGQKEVNVEFSYENLKLMKEELTEDQYVAERTADLNEKAKGNGDTWAKKWEASKELAWQPKFTELVNIVLTKKKKDLTFQEGLKSAKYTLIVDVVWMYPGYNVVMAKKGAKVTTVLRFVETANRSNVLLELTSENAPGDVFGGSFSNEDRIREGFAKTGKTLAALILKNVK
ncbi:hypothetical protein [Flavobacterium sp. N2270]|uniref:hypothetical protein n=1 Tax=Flavobacterium sp. N2270 TaxID=2986831 RepID=UPI0022249E49|nr:hypothetical protein [Flavobacterium sp. N2270]